MLPFIDDVEYALERLEEEKVARVVGDHIVNGRPVDEYTIGANS